MNTVLTLFAENLSQRLPEHILTALPQPYFQDQHRIRMAVEHHFRLPENFPPQKTRSHFRQRVFYQQQIITSNRAFPVRLPRLFCSNFAPLRRRLHRLRLWCRVEFCRSKRCGV